MDSSPRSPEQLNTLEALIQLFVNYLHTAKEPDTEGYSWVSAGCFVCVVYFFTCQSTSMVMSRRSVQLTTFFPGEA